MKKYFLLLTAVMILGGCQSNPLNNDQNQLTKPVINNVNSEKAEPQKVSVTVADEDEETINLSKKELDEIKAANKDVALDNEDNMTVKKDESTEQVIEKAKDENSYPGYPLRYNVKTADNNVKKIQSRLNAIGYNLEVDGYFGQKTMDAVKFIQEQNGLEIDGIVGPLTWDALFNNTLTVEEGGMGDE